MSRGKIRKWTPEEDNFLRDNAPIMTIRELAEKLTASWVQVWHRANQLKVSPVKVHKKWTSSDLAIALQQDADTASKLLGRTKIQIYSRTKYARDKQGYKGGSQC